jgi:uncharacterized circularly permuted ATP-grasp superfamily protein/uncharacterized alpha-E superfamily protein
VAFDLARGPDGRWSVVGQRTQAPSGLGYLLENRLAVAPQFPNAFARLHVQRIAAGFRSLHRGLLRDSPAGERSRIALLTPGPFNETYFEHVFLARYLGIALVEAGDLTVRHDRLYLKTMHGLERVHALLRRVDDDFLDPLELRPDSTLGVPGLLQVVRTGQVVLANMPGAGVLESPGLSAFWPGANERLFGEPLEMPALTTWWCGEPAVWQAQRGHLSDFNATPSFPASASTASFEPAVLGELDEKALARWRARIDADPAAYTLQAPVRPSETPVWRDGRLLPRAAVWRVFALADGEGGWSVLPGGLTRVAAAQAEGGSRDPWLSMQHGSASADTWVMTDGEVDPLSLLPKPLTAADLADRHRSVTSRAAENLFWLGRYTERAENAVRLVRLTLENLATDDERVIAALGELAERHGLVPPGTPEPWRAPRVFERALLDGLTDGKATTSVGFNLRHLRDCAQALRERLSPEHWHLIVEVVDHFEQHLAAVLAAWPGEADGETVPGAPGEGDADTAAEREGGEALGEALGEAGDGPGAAPTLHAVDATPPTPAAAAAAAPMVAESPELVADMLGVLSRVATHLAAITGAQTDRMTRDDGWRLLSVGRHLERLDTQAHALGTAMRHRLHESEDGFAFILGLFDSTITYRAQFQARRELLPLLHLLVLDTDNPRALAWVARTMHDRFVKLARPQSGWAEEIAARLPRPQDWALEDLATLDAEGRPAVLLQALDDGATATQRLAEALSLRLFSHARAVDRLVWQ